MASDKLDAAAIPEGFEPFEAAPVTPEQEQALPEGFEAIEVAPSFIERAGKFVRGAVTGEGRIDPSQQDVGEFAPEIDFLTKGSEEGSGLTTDQINSIATTLQLVPNEKAQRDILSRISPDLEFREDSKGNIQIKNPKTGEFEFLNKPGVSGRDFVQLIGEIIQFTPAGRLLRGAGTVARAGAVATASGATSLAQDVGAGIAGSKQGIDLVKLTLTTLGGGAGETFLPAAQAFVRNLPLGRKISMTEAQQIAQQAGFDPRAVTGEFIERLNQANFKAEARGAVSGGTAGAASGEQANAVAGRALGDQFGVPLTQGQLTRNPAQISAEERLIAGGRGTRGQEITRGFRDEQQIPAIQQAQTRIAQQGDDALPASRDDASLAVTDQLRERAGAAQSQIDDAFDSARAADAAVDRQSARGLGTNIRNELNEQGFDLDDGTPAAQRALNVVRSLVPRLPEPKRQAGFLAREGASQPQLTPLSIRDMNAARKRINRQFKTADNDTDRAAVTLIKRRYDEWMGDAIDNALISGDPKALELLRNANRARTEFGRLFEERLSRAGADVAGRNVNRIINDPNITNREVSNWLFGNAKIGQSPVNVRMANRLVEIFGPDSPEITGIRQANVRGLFFNPRTNQSLVGVDQPRQGFQQIVSNIDEFIDGSGREYASILHTPEQLAELATFRDLMKRFVPPDRTVSSSGSDLGNARAVIDGFNKVVQVFGLASGNPAAGLAAPAINAATNLTGKRAANRAVAQALNSMPLPPTVPIGQAAGAQASNQ